MQKISRESLGFMAQLDWPEGKWQKGDTTTLLMVSWRHRIKPATLSANGISQVFPSQNSQEWLEDMLTDDVVTEFSQQDPRVPFIALAVQLG